ncbi:expressed unknown protein [Seminavis robusta]|uniref:Uncharacterized protein n=1 Tax=Seminavis robusta TaxID=568900 RepID=A0A9N8F024_9STRA|nr:expressed unknown protein [Seminavis robusta]|eukprot:Sro2517_g330020.1 n/a (682) ;mRNA; f:6974-9019
MAKVGDEMRMNLIGNHPPTAVGSCSDGSTYDSRHTNNDDSSFSPQPISSRCNLTTTLFRKREPMDLPERSSPDLVIRPVVTVDEESPAAQQQSSLQSPLTTSFSARTDGKLYQSTILTDLIGKKHYLEAIRRLQTHPSEASEWVQLTENDMPYERLPLHLACASLATASELQSRFQLEQLILKLVLTYPDGCSLVDYDNRLPLHECVWNNATPETISMLLMGDPTSMYQRDPCGRNAAEVNRHRCGVFMEQVQELLSRGMEFWETARKQKWGQPPAMQALIMAAESHNHHYDDKSEDEEYSLTIGSLCVPKEMECSAYDSSLTPDEYESIITESTMAPMQPPVITQRPLGNHQRPEQQAFQSPVLNHTFSFGENVASREKAIGREILQNMLNDLMEQNKQLSSTLTELAKTNAEMQRTNTEKLLSPALSPPPQSLLETPESLPPLLLAASPHQHHSNNDAELAALRAQNSALRRKCDRLNSRRKKQADKIQFLKSLLASEDVLVDISDSQSESTHSLLSGTQMTPLSQSFDGNSSYVRHPESVLSTPESSVNDTKRNNVVISGLAAYQFNAYVSSLQQRIGPTPKKQGQGDDDNLADMFRHAAKLYSDHVKECPWRNGKLILQWEPSRTTTTTMPDYDRRPPTHRYAVGQVNVDHGSVISYEETSLSSMGMISGGNRNRWI